MIEHLDEHDDGKVRWQNSLLRAKINVYEHFLVCRTSEELVDGCLRIVEEVLESPVVYIGEFSEGAYCAQAPRAPDKQRCSVRCESGCVRMRRRFPQGSLITAVVRAAVPLRTDACQSYPELSRYPQITDFLGIPFIVHNRVAGVLAVANCPYGYALEQQELLSALVLPIFQCLLKKRGEEAAQENELLMRAVMDSATDFLFIKDRKSRVVMVNPAYGRIFGVDIADVIGKDDYALYADPEMAKCVIENDRYVMRTGQTLVCQEAAMTVDGFKTFQLSKVPWRGVNGRVMGILGIAHDVTELKEAKDTLEKTVASLRHSKEYIDILYDITGKLLCAQAPRREIEKLCVKVMRFVDCDVFFNYLLEEGEEVLHLNACGGVSEEQREQLEYLPLGAAVCGCVVRDGCRIVTEHIQMTYDPRTDFLRTMGIRAYACHPLLNHGKALGSLAFGTHNRDRFTDADLMLMKAAAETFAVAISRKQNEELLIRQAEELRVADCYKNQFLSALSHELRNPIATISMGLSLIEATQASGQQDKAMSIMGRQIEQLNHLVDDLLNLTRITQHKLTLKNERLGLNRLALSILEDYQPQYEEKHIRLDCFVPRDEICIYADPVRLKQTIGNLIHNALKFTDDGGAVRLSIEVEGGEAVVRVRDTGKGIEAAFQKEIFEPFIQLEDSLDRKNGGLGLGLFIVKQITELHGGSVSVHSAGRGKGAEFTIRLPMAQPVTEDKPVDEAALSDMAN